MALINEAEAHHQDRLFAYKQAQDTLDATKSLFHSLRAEQGIALMAFNKAKAELDVAEKAFLARIDILRSFNHKCFDEKRRIAEKAGVPSCYSDNVWILTDVDLSVHIYFGGIDSPDGPG